MCVVIIAIKITNCELIFDHFHQIRFWKDDAFFSLMICDLPPTFSDLLDTLTEACNMISALSTSYFNLICSIEVKPNQVEIETKLLGPSEQPSLTEEISSFVEYFEEFMRSIGGYCGR